MFKSNLNFYLKSTINMADSAGDTFLISEDFELGEVIDTDGETASIVLRNARSIERYEVTVTAGVATIVKRGLTQDDTVIEDADLKKQWTEGTIGYITALAFDLVDNENATPDRLTIPVVADTTARDSLYPSPSGGELVEVTSLGSATQKYNAVTAQWETFGIGTSVPVMSTTVTGIGRVASTAQSKAGTNVDSGNPLLVSPSDIAKNTQSGTFVYGADSGGDDAYTVAMIPVLAAYTVGQSLYMNVTTPNTGACTADLGPGVKNIKTRSGYDPVDGQVNGIVHLVYDGTNLVLQNQNPLVKFGDGSDGALSISSGTTMIPMVNNYVEKNYSSMNVSGTALLTFSGAVTNGGVAVINCAGDFTMSAGTISGNGMGGVLGLGGSAAAAGTGGTNGNRIIRGLLRSAAVSSGELDFGGFYKGYCGAGGTGGTGGNANAGVNAGGTGGNGGMLILIRVGGAINFTGGTISSNGAAGGNGVNTGGAGSGGGGGGAGGSVIILYNNLISKAGTIAVNGGNGGTGAIGQSGLGTGGAGGAGGASFSNAGGGGAVNTGGSNGTSNAYGTGGTGGGTGGPAGANNGGGGGGGGGAGFYIIDYYEKYRN